MVSFSEPPVNRATVVIPNWNGAQWLLPCLAALEKQSMRDFTTVVIDNGSQDGSVQLIRHKYPAVKVIALQKNSGFAHAVNLGIAEANSPYVALLNADTEPYPDWLAQLVHKIETLPIDVAGIASQMLQMGDPSCIDDAGDFLSWYGAATKRGHASKANGYQNEIDIFSPCAGACLYRREFLATTGGFDPEFFAYLEDIDLGLRGRLLGYRFLYLPAAKVLHKGQGSNTSRARYVELVTRNRLLLFAKNIPMLLLLRHAVKLVYGQLYFLIAYRRPWASLKGYVSFLAILPATLRKRWQLLQKIVLDPTEVDVLLGKTPPTPRLSQLLTRYFYRFVAATVGKARGGFR